MVRVERGLMVLLLIWGLALGTSSRVAGQDAEAQVAEAERLNKQVIELYVAGRYNDAIPLAELALATSEKAFGAEHINVGIALNILAQLYHLKGEYVRAEPLHKRALAIREKALGPVHQDVANTLNGLAELYRVTGDFVQAEALFKRALAIREKVFGGDHLEVASSLNNLAVLYRDKGDYALAEPLIQRALDIMEKTFSAQHPNFAISLNNLASLYHDKGDYVRAEQLYQRALVILEEALGNEHPWLAIPLDGLASLYTNKGDYARAEPLFLRALAIVEKALGTEHTSVAQSLNNLAALYEAKGDYAHAEPLFKRAMAIWEKALGAEHPNVAQSLNNLGAISEGKGDHVHAELLFKRALAIWEKALGADHPNNAQSLNNLAVLYEARGDYARAEPLFKRALAIWENALGPNHPEVANSLTNLAVLYRAKGDYTRAVQFHGRAEDVLEHNLSLMLSTGSEGQKQLYLDTINGGASTVVSLHVRSAPSDGQAAELAITAILRHKGRALDAMTDQIAGLRQRAAPEDQQLLDQLGVAQSGLAKLRFAGSSPSDSSTPEQRRAQDERLTIEIENLQAGISRRNAEFRTQAQAVTLEPVQQTLPADAALVEIFSYLPLNVKGPKATDRFGAPRYVAYVLKQKGAITFVELGATEVIDRAADQFLTVISNPANVNAKETGRALDEMVARPIRKLLGNVRHLLISPDGKLNLVPFAALVDEKGKYLVENYTISYLTSGRDLLRLLPHQSKQTPVVMGNPDFDIAIASTLAGTAATAGGNRNPLSQTQTAADTGGRRSGNLPLRNWSALRGTAEEADYLKKLLPDALVFTGKYATETAVKQVAAPRILHLATHGFFLPDQPRDPDDKVRTVGENPLLRSGLVLAGANNLQGGGGEDGVLTALEAAGLNLWGTQLVVLSACETGVGDVRSGEGVYGLRRAFVLAGTESQVMTLWKVDDTATSEAIIEYYRRLQAGEGRAEALRLVQLEFLRRKTRQHPFFWASFILNGDWRSMR